MIFPSYLNQPANSLTIYNQMFLITKTYSDNGNKDLIYEIGNHKIIVDDIKELLLNEITNPKDCIDFYRIKLKNDSNSYYLCENSEFMEKIINNLNYDGKIWYVND